MKVLFLTNIPSPYRVDFFNELGKYCDLTVIFEKTASSERDQDWSNYRFNTFNGIFLKGISTSADTAFCPNVTHYLNKSYDAIIICGTSSPTEILATEWCRLKNIPFFIEGDGAFAKNGNGLKEKLKKHIISKGKLFFSTCHEHDKYYTHYGANPDNVVRYRFSSLKEKDILSEPVKKEEKSALREELGIKEEQVVLSVGQFIHRKGFDVLLEATKQISSNIGVYIVGGTPTEEYLSFVRDYNLANVHFEGFKKKEELKKYYKSADVFVLPTREDIWGLVVNEAMAHGLPVITTDRCNAGLELIKNGVNGYIVPIDSAEDIGNAITESLSQTDKLGAASLEIIKDYTVENMAKDHIGILNELLNKKK